MSAFRCDVLFLQILFLTFCFCEINHVKENEYLKHFLEFLNNLPNKPYIYENGLFLGAQRDGENIYKFTSKIKVRDIKDGNNINYLICRSTIVDNGEQGGEIQKDYHCSDIVEEDDDQFGGNLEEVVKDPVTSTEEINYSTQSNNVVMPGKQLTHDKSEHCMGCVKTSQLDNTKEVRITQKKGDSTLSLEEGHIRNADPLSDDKNMVIDDLINFINFAGFDPTVEKEKVTEDVSRMKKNFSPDLQVMSLQEKFYKLKKHLINAKLLYKLGQVLVDYLNEMDMEVKTRVLNEILAAEEEYEGNQNYFYIKARINIPCDKAECLTNDTEIKICNGVLEYSKVKTPKVLTAFCHKDDSKIPKLGAVKDIPFDDPILLKIINEAVKKIETDLTISNALKPVKIISATNQKVSGTLIKISMVLGYTDCNITVHSDLRENNCRIVKHLGSKVCDVEVLERHWIKEKKLTYNCNERPIDLSFSEANEYSKKNVGSVEDPIVLAIAQDALHYLETESNVNKKQAILKIQSVTTQILAGMLTEVEFIVGYTECEYNLKYSPYTAEKSIKDCKILQNQQLRTCKARVWERPWLQDDRQFNVTCKLDNSDHNKMSMIKKEKPLELNTPRKRNPNDPKYYKLADISLKKYLVSRNINRHHKILKIEQVTTQQGSGVLTKIKFVISPTNCSMDPNGIVLPSMNCVALNHIHHCAADITERPWIDNIFIEINCTKLRNSASSDAIVSQDDIERSSGKVTDNSKSKSRVKRAVKNEMKRVVRNSEMGGGETIENENLSTYKTLADESLQVYLEDSGTTEKYDVIKVTKVTSRVVEGNIINIDFDIAPTKCKKKKKVLHCHSEIVDIPWQNKRDISVNCSLNSPGVESIENKSNPKYKSLAEEAMQKYAKDKGTTENYEVLQVNKVTTQEAKESITKIDFEAVSMKCKNKKGVLYCHAEISEVPLMNKRDITVECDSQKALVDPNSQESDDSIKFGERLEQNASDPTYGFLAEKSLQKYLKDTNTLEEYTLVKVNKVHTQVVAGILTIISFDANCQTCDMIRCESKILDQQWLNQTDITVQCKKKCSKQKLTAVEVGASDVNPVDTNPGDPVEKDPEDPQYKALAAESLRKYEYVTDSTINYQVSKVNKVTSRVVSGFITTIDFDVTATNCLNRHKRQRKSSCDELHCHSEIYEKPWENIKSITIYCMQHELMVGFETIEDENDPKFKILAEDSLTKYLKKSQTTESHIVTRVNKVRSQLVGGRLTNIEFEASSTSCHNRHKRTNCQVLKCNSRILEHDSKDISVNCSSLVKQTKLSAVEVIASTDKPSHGFGAKTEEDPKDPKYKVLAEESLRKYEYSTDSTINYQVSKVNKVTSQVVSGFITTIDFDVTATNCLNRHKRQRKSSCAELHCHSEIYEKPWENIKSITIYCMQHELMVGFETIEDENDPKFKKLADDSLNKYLKKSQTTESYKVTRVNKVRSQLVGGKLTNIEFEASSTSCQNRHKRTNCQVLKCNSRILEHDSKDISVNCSSLVKQTKLSAVEVIANTEKPSHGFGAKTEEDPKDLKYKVLAEESLRKYEYATDSTISYQVKKVKKVTGQVVSGFITTIDFDASPTNCPNRHKRQRKLSCEVLNCHSTIYEVIWENKKSITVSCGGIGGLTVQDETHPKYKIISEQSLNQYLEIAQITESYIVKRVEKVVSQLVSGSITNIKFKASPTSCQNRHKRTFCKDIDCHSKVWKQKWLDRTAISVNCSNVLKSVGTKLKPISTLQIYGGEMIQEPTDPKYKTLAEESLQEYEESSGTTNSYEITKVTRVTTQVVGGLITRIEFEASGNNIVLNCRSKIWKMTWSHDLIDIDCTKKQKFREKREVSDYNDKDFIESSIFLELASKSLEVYNKRFNVAQQYKIKQLTNFTVFGYKTKLYFEAVPINDSLIVQDSSKETSLLNAVLKCYSEVLERPWKGLKKTNITVVCINKNEPQYKELAEESLQQYLQYSGITQYYQVTDIIDVNVYGVSTVTTKINFNVSRVSCLFEKDVQSVNECQIINASETFKCKSVVLEQDWLHKKEISVKCFIPHTSDVSAMRYKVDQIGRNLENPEYKIFAEKSLKQYLKSVKNTQQYQLVRVTDVTTQAVAGLKTKIYFDISPTSCNVGTENKLQRRSLCHNYIRNCFSEIWERPWLFNTVIVVDCFAPILSEYKVNELANTSLRHYLRSSTRHFVMRRITHFSNGGIHLPTKIDFEISPTNCSMDKINSDCKPIDEIFTCHSEIKDLLSWHKNNMNVNCFQNNLHSDSNNLGHGFPFSEIELDVNQNYSEYRGLAELAMRQYRLMRGLSQHYDIIRIKRVTAKSKSNRSINIYFDISPTNCTLDDNVKLHSSTCKVIDSSKSYDCFTKIQKKYSLITNTTNTEDISVKCNINQQSRIKREAITGDTIEKVPSSSIRFLELAEESLDKYLESSRIQQIFKIIKILRATTQMVSGSLSTLDFLISSTNCSLNETNKNICITNNSTVYRCHSNVWERPWLTDDLKVISVECNNSEDLSLLSEDYSLTDVNHKMERVIRSVRPSIKSGSPQEQDASLPKFKKFAKESLNKYVTKKHIQDAHEVLKVNRVTKKVVSGFKYAIDFTAMPKTCYRNNSCIGQESLMLKCNSEIWDRPWLKRKDVKVACRRQTLLESDVLNGFAEDTTNKSVPISEFKKDTIIPPNITVNNIRKVAEYKEIKNKDVNKYKILAEQALQKYEHKSLYAYLYKVTEIHRVRERVTGDMGTNIQFSALLTDCQKNIYQTVDEQCKIQEPKIGIWCEAEIKSLIPKIDKNIEIKCKNKRIKNVSLSTTESNHEEVVVTRERRQLITDDDYVEEDMKYYYAERALYDYNKRSGTNNLYKVMTIHDTDRSYHMKTLMYRMYLEIAMTYCMRNGEENDIQYCDEIETLSHKLCLARIYPSPDDEMIIKHISMVCDDDTDFQTVTGLSVKDLVKASIAEIEKSPNVHYRLAHQGEANLVPTLTYALPMRLSFLAVTTNCTKDVDLVKHAYRCWVDDSEPAQLCTSYIYMIPNTRNIHHMDANCRKPPGRTRRAISTNPDNATTDDLLIQQMVQEAIDKLEMSSLQRYKQRVLLINSYSTKITTGKVTTIDFDLGYTNCLKFEWVENITSCEFIEHLPRRHCVAKFFERLWTKTRRSIDVNCEDDETPLEAHIEFESAENAMHLAKEALKHIEAKYPSPHKQKVVRIFSLEKQTIAGLHYRMKIEVGLTDCVALSTEENCKFISDATTNKFCRINVWVRPWTDHPPSYRVSCDYQEGTTTEIYHEIQAEHLFFDFLTKYKPNYANDFAELKKRYKIFSDNIKKIHELNIYERGTAKYAVTRFADLTYEEFGEKYLGLKLSLADSNHTIPMADIPKVELPDKFDWRDFDAVTEVKDQGACGSCWAFSVTGNIEGQWKMQSGQLVSLSEQELVDCDKLDNGCSGGLPDNAYRAIEQLGGLEAEKDYPYEGVNDKCSFNKTLSKVQISGAVNISSNETDMAKWLVQNGPISIGINANAMQFYVGGVSHPWKVLCNPTNLDHGVLVVGYGEKDYPLFHKKLPYWIIKNSWGERWGEQGYYRVYRGDGTCGVNQMASSAVI